MKNYHSFKVACFTLSMLLITHLSLGQKNQPQVKALFSNQHSIQQELLDLIAQEKKKIQIAVFRFSDRCLADALLHKKSLGTKIEIITDAGSLDSRINQILRLHQCGIPIYIYPPGNNGNNHGLMHHKFCLFSNNSEAYEQIIWTGSYNFTKAAATINQENVVIIKNDNKTWLEFTKLFRELKKLSQRL